MTKPCATRRPLGTALAFAVLNSLAACTGLSREEAVAALEESRTMSEGNALAFGPIELSTQFTLGRALEQAAQELHDFAASQIPCATLTLEGTTLTIDYGSAGESCLYRGQRYLGIHRVTLTRNEAGGATVSHVWDNLRNSRTALSGTAEVTWNTVEGTRRVVHNTTWTPLGSGGEQQGVQQQGEERQGEGERGQQALAGEISEGIALEGRRSWTSDRGSWALDIEGVEARWADPLPQTGTYTLTTPFAGKTMILRFNRVDDDTIEATVQTGMRTYDFRVSASQ